MNSPARAERSLATTGAAARHSGSLSFAAAVAYVIVEYLRPQERYDALAVIPFGQIVGVLLILACWMEQRRFPFSQATCKWIVVLLVWLFIVSLFGPYPSTSLLVWTDILKMAVLAVFTAAALDTRERLYKYLIVVLVLYFLHTNFVFRGWVASGFSVGFRGMWVGSGPLRNPNDFGAALAAFWGISLAMVWADRARRVKRVKRSWLHVINTVLFAVAFLTSSSRGAAFAFVAGAIYSARRLRLLARGLAVLVVLAAVYVATASPEQLERFRGMGGEEDSTGIERIETWKIAREVFEDNPLLGIGVGVFPRVSSRYTTSEALFVQHNIYLQALTEAGIPGLLMVFGMLWSFFRNQRYVGRELDLHAHDPPLLPWVAFGLNVSMISFMVAGFFITVLFYPFMWVLLGISMATRRLAELEDVTNQGIRAGGQRRSQLRIP